MSQATIAIPAELALLEQRLEALEQKADSPDALSIVAFSGELDRLLAAMVMATGAAACGTKVSLFFTFWATACLKKNGRQSPDKPLVERCFGWMLPGGFQRPKLSQLNLAGLGRRLMAREMAKKNVPSLSELFQLAQELDVDLHVCEMSMSLLGIRPEELIAYPGLRYSGVATFLEQASRSQTTLFI